MIVAAWATRDAFPMGTLTVNLIGSFLLGLLLYGGITAPWTEQRLTAFLAVGVLGGFTTMSTFAFEAVAQAEVGQWRQSSFYIASTLIGCLLMAWLGRWIGLRWIAHLGS